MKLEVPSIITNCPDCGNSNVSNLPDWNPERIFEIKCSACSFHYGTRMKLTIDHEYFHIRTLKQKQK